MAVMGVGAVLLIGTLLMAATLEAMGVAGAYDLVTLSDANRGILGQVAGLRARALIVVAAFGLAAASIAGVAFGAFDALAAQGTAIIFSYVASNADVIVGALRAALIVADTLRAGLTGRAAGFITGIIAQTLPAQSFPGTFGVVLTGQDTASARAGLGRTTDYAGAIQRNTAAVEAALIGGAFRGRPTLIVTAIPIASLTGRTGARRALVIASGVAAVGFAGAHLHADRRRSLTGVIGAADGVALTILTNRACDTGHEAAVLTHTERLIGCDGATDAAVGTFGEGHAVPFVFITISIHAAVSGIAIHALTKGGIRGFVATVEEAKLSLAAVDPLTWNRAISIAADLSGRTIHAGAGVRIPAGFRIHTARRAATGVNA